MAAARKDGMVDKAMYRWNDCTATFLFFTYTWLKVSLSHSLSAGYLVEDTYPYLFIYSFTLFLLIWLRAGYSSPLNASEVSSNLSSRFGRWILDNILLPYFSDQI